jgi:hypothetical protein
MEPEGVITRTDFIIRPCASKNGTSEVLEWRRAVMKDSVERVASDSLSNRI